jgi:regulator of sirC expression with transglutaminase-like and TPR domain
MRIRELWSDRDESLLATFEMSVAVDDLPGALLALEGACGTRAKKVRATLGAWAERLAAVLASTDAHHQAEALAHLIHRELGFTAELTSDRPEDGFLSRVLERRRGRPALLAALWMELGRLAGVSVAPFARTGRLLLRVGGDAGILVDPVAGRSLAGEEPSAGEAREAAQALRPLAFNELVGFAIKHFINCYALRNDLIEVFRAISFVCALQPHAPTPCLQRAAIAEQLGAHRFADDLYRHVAANFPGTQESQLALQKLMEAMSRGPVLLQ